MWTFRNTVVQTLMAGAALMSLFCLALYIPCFVYHENKGTKKPRVMLVVCGKEHQRVAERTRIYAEQHGYAFCHVVEDIEDLENLDKTFMDKADSIVYIL
jgi:hypothetical protein